MRGYVGPAWQALPGFPRPGRVWAAEPRWVKRLSDPAEHNWPRTRHAWYFQAHARHPDASVFVEKSVRDLTQTHMLAQHFPNARFLFSVRNPYAVCEGICRRFREDLPQLAHADAWGGRSLEEVAATHTVNLLRMQVRNQQDFGDRGVFFTYETMCAEPQRVARQIQSLAPEIEDLDLRRRVQVKDYDETLSDMNARHIARLDATQLGAINRVFAAAQDLIEGYGYKLLEEAPEGA